MSAGIRGCSGDLRFVNGMFVPVEEGDRKEASKEDGLKVVKVNGKPYFVPVSWSVEKIKEVFKKGTYTEEMRPYLIN